MPKKGGSKGGSKNRSISNVKKSNIRKNKLVRAGKLKPKSKPKFVEGGQFTKKAKGQEKLTADQLESRQEYEDEKKKREEDMYKEMVEDMMDPEDVAYLKKNANRGKAFNIQATQTSKKRKRDENDEQNGDDEDEDERFCLTELVCFPIFATTFLWGISLQGPRRSCPAGPAGSAF